MSHTRRRFDVSALLALDGGIIALWGVEEGPTLGTEEKRACPGQRTSICARRNAPILWADMEEEEAANHVNVDLPFLEQDKTHRDTPRPWRLLCVLSPVDFFDKGTHRESAVSASGAYHSQ